MNILSRGVGESFAVFLLPVAQAFDADRAALTGVYSTYMMMIGLVSPLAGVAVDRLGARRCYLAGTAMLGTVAMLNGMITALWQMYLLIGVFGAIAATLIGMVPASSLVSRWFGARLPTAMATLSAAMGTGMLVFAPLAQWLIGHLGWRNAYLLIGAVLLAILLPMAFLPWKRISAGSAPVVEALRARGSLQPAWTVPRALRTTIFWALAGVMFFTAVSTYAVSVQLVACLVDAGYSPITAASVFGSVGMLSIVGMLAAGALAERIGERGTATLSYGLTLLGLLLLGLALRHPSPWLVTGFVLSFGCMQGTRGPLVATLAARAFPGAMGRVYGMVLLGMGAGAALGSWAGGMLYDLTGGYEAALLLSAAGALCGLALFWTVRGLDAKLSSTPTAGEHP